MNFTPNQTYPSKTHGTVVFRGLETCQGRTVYCFHSLTYTRDSLTVNEKLYWSLEELPDHFQLP